MDLATPAIVATSEVFCKLSGGGVFAAWLTSEVGVEMDADDMRVLGEDVCLLRAVQSVTRADR